MPGFYELSEDEDIDWEKRFKDAQRYISKLQDEKKELKENSIKDLTEEKLLDILAAKQSERLKEDKNKLKKLLTNKNQQYIKDYT